MRMFDLRRPDAEPELLLENGAAISHDGTVKSVVWVGEHTGVTAGEDGIVKYAIRAASVERDTENIVPQMVGSAHKGPVHEHDLPWPHHVHGALPADEPASGHLWQDRRVHPGTAERRQQHPQSHSSICAVIGLYSPYLTR